jgi:hypothetical protein
MKYLIVTGRFDVDGGRPSKIGQIIASAIVTHRHQLKDVRHVNGGHLKEIPELALESPHYDVVIWFPDVITTYNIKYVNEIKRHNKKCLLVTSKNNVGQEYELPELIQKALVQRANLFLEIRQSDHKEGKFFVARLLDPLGNQYLDRSGDFPFSGDFCEIANRIIDRTIELKGFTRIGCVQVGEAQEVPDEVEFFNLVRNSAAKFHELLPPPNITDRFVGNASFRCGHGFPSFRKGGMIYVSRRNVDKEHIDRESFVAVKNGVKRRTLEPTVDYYGNCKPSIDAPIHLKLYDLYPKVNYILHGHVYLHGFPSTGSVIPCGALEEAEEIFSRLKHEAYTSFGLNLKGHGFIALADNVERLREMMAHVKPRPFPEVID